MDYSACPHPEQNLAPSGLERWQFAQVTFCATAMGITDGGYAGKARGMGGGVYVVSPGTGTALGPAGGIFPGTLIVTFTGG